jgi:hypothetical protein
VAGPLALGHACRPAGVKALTIASTAIWPFAAPGKPGHGDQDAEQQQRQRRALSHNVPPNRMRERHARVPDPSSKPTIEAWSRMMLDGTAPQETLDAKS